MLDKKINIAVLVSGGGTNLQALIDAEASGIIKSGKMEEYAIHGGAINVTKEKISVVCNAIENKKDIDKRRALAAKERAEKRLQDKDPNIDIKRAQLALQRALIRLELAGKD